MCLDFTFRGLECNCMRLLPDEQLDLELCDAGFEVDVAADSGGGEICCV